MSEFTIYTDGSCINNPGPGGWAAIIIDNATGEREEISGGNIDTTNNRMEILAVISALRKMKKGDVAEIFTDSTYVQNALTKGWLNNWKSNGWLTTGKKPVLNQDMWQELDKLLQDRIVNFKWVRGHNGNTFNEWCDRLAYAAAEKSQRLRISKEDYPLGSTESIIEGNKGLPTSNGDNQNESSGPAEFIDSDTQLHTYNYGMARISDELYRAGRYNHPVSAFMIRIVFPQLLPDDDMEKYVRPFRAYCARVMKDTRQTDTVIQAGEFQIIAVLSECPYQMVESIIERLTSIVNALCPTFEEFLHVTVLNVYETYEGGNNLPTAQELVDKLTQQMTRKYSATALSQ